MTPAPKKAGKSKYARKKANQRKLGKPVAEVDTDPSAVSSTPVSVEPQVAAPPSVASSQQNGKPEVSWMGELKALAQATTNFITEVKGFEAVHGSFGPREGILVNTFVQECAKRLKKIKEREYVSKKQLEGALKSAIHLAARFRKRTEDYIDGNVGRFQAVMARIKTQAPTLYGEANPTVMDLISTLTGLMADESRDYEAISQAFQALTERMDEVDRQRGVEILAKRKAERKAQVQAQAAGVADDLLKALSDAGFEVEL